MITALDVHKTFPDLGKASLRALLRGHVPSGHAALSGISFHLPAGRSLGLIGPNGAGKSTLLKILSGLSLPSSGSVQVRGRGTAILELSTGFSPRLSGRENAARRLALSGFSLSEIRRLMEDIVDFSELEDVIDDPLYTYSTGMNARLAFAVVTAAPFEVMFIDEILAVGDEHFQGKCLKRLRQCLNEGRTLVMATHDMNHLERFCQDGLCLQNGRPAFQGSAHETAMFYRRAPCFWPREEAEISAFDLAVERGCLVLAATIERKKAIADLQAQFTVHDNAGGMLILLLNSLAQGRHVPSGLGPLRILCRVPLPPGLRSGLAALALLRGPWPGLGSKVDGWGWDTGRHREFSIPGPSGMPYLEEAVTWTITKSA
ncbi:MAG: ABC transporter ATP-binding protein [Deltaproteobacteria bacterium]|jgi:ABC-type polysaccharide/polyol phosphate transport system ATPase subunit|nr:ABC transporter ATP-binding protein [Deltaproteobacteria bacterium]